MLIYRIDTLSFRAKIDNTVKIIYKRMKIADEMSDISITALSFV